ncbi:heparanase-like protein 2 [Pistacia vera]|uniref:heparanase-like protein 2 n=1 Tax=Pistacia vera TaxID=55513 RepID=UPI001263B871|nr:heparanase-like protein 2 [Pistacia vera]
MKIKAVSFLLLLTLFSLCLAEDLKVAVQGVTSIGTTDDNFVCATLDWWPVNKCDYDQCPWGKAGILNLDLKNKILSNAIKAFNSLRIRVGGSLQDQVLYKVGNSIKKCPHFKLRKDGLFGFSHGCLFMDRWNELNQLFKQTGAVVTFALNALIGRHKSKTDKVLWEGDWHSENARDLMKYTITKGYNIESYELGNELCGSGVSARVAAEQYAKDIVVLKNLVKELYPNATTQPKVLGPAGFYDKKWFQIFLEQSGQDVVDGLTHHIYNLGAGNDPALITRIQDPFYLNQIAQTYKDMEMTVKEFGPWSGAWVGEAGGAYNSGGKTVSHTFVNGFWYLDQLGMTSTFNHKVFCRQALIGGNYALLNTTTFIPNPDYYGALLWHRLMGKNVLSVKHSGSPYLRVYSHCARDKPGISMLLINMSNKTSFDVSVINDENLYGEFVAKEDGGKMREEYHLTPKDGNIQSDEILLNGTPLKLTNSSDIPPMNPKLFNPSSPISVAADSIVFVTLRDFDAPACA